MSKLFILAIAGAILTGAPALADNHVGGHKMKMTDTMEGGTVKIEHPWARASIGRNGAAYFTLVNNGKTDDMLIGVMADVAKRVELHTHKMDGDIMRMRPIDSVPVPSGATVMLKPGGHHVMFMGLTRKLKEGESFPMTLVFEKAGKMQISVKIGKIGAAGPMGDMKPMGGHGGHKMKH